MLSQKTIQPPIKVMGPSAKVFLQTAACITLPNSSSSVMPLSWCFLMMSLKLTSFSFVPNKQTLILSCTVICRWLQEEQKYSLIDVMNPMQELCALLTSLCACLDSPPFGCIIGPIIPNITHQWRAFNRHLVHHICIANKLGHAPIIIVEWHPFDTSNVHIPMKYLITYSIWTKSDNLLSFTPLITTQFILTLEVVSLLPLPLDPRSQISPYLFWKA